MRSALWAGVPFKDIGPMAPGDIKIAADVELEKQKEFYRMMAWIGYNCVALSGVAVNDPKKFPTLEEAFPTLFERKEQQDWWVIKERVEKFAIKQESFS